MGKNVPKLRFKGFEGEWEEKKIGDITLKVGSGKTPRGGNSVYTDSGVMFLRSQNVFNGYMVLDDVAYITEEENNKMKSTSVYENDILLNITGASIGRCCVVPNLNNKANVNQHVCIIRPKKDTNSSFIMNQIIGYKVQRQIDSYQAGGNREGLNFQQIKEIKINIPSLQEQEKIANLLSKVDRYIELQEKKVSELEKYKKGMMQKIFSQKIRFRKDDGGEYPEWDEKRFKDIFDSFEYGMNSAAIEFDGENKYIRITDIDENSSKYRSDNIVSPDGVLEEKFLVKENDILFARTGASVGKTYLYNKNDGKLYFAGFLIRGHVNSNNDARFIFSTTQTADYKKWVKIMSMRSGQPGINSQEYASYKLRVPCLQEQMKIANFIYKIDILIENQNKRLEELKLWKRGLLQKMFV